MRGSQRHLSADDHLYVPHLPFRLPLKASQRLCADDSLALVNKSFGFYINSSMPAACDSYPEKCDHGGWNMDGDTNYPDSALQCHQLGPSSSFLLADHAVAAVFMDGVGRHQSSFHSYATFFEQAKNGTLPHLSFIHPNDTWTDVSEIDIALDLCKWCLSALSRSASLQ